MDAEALFSETFGRFMSNWAYVMSLRQFAEIALPLTQQALTPIHEAAVEAIAADQEFSQVIVNLDGTPTSWGNELKAFLRAGMTDTTVSNSKTAIDAACLVFAQSMLDDAAMSYCRVCAALAPDDWNGVLNKKQLDYATLRAKSAEAIRDELLASALKQMERESLMKKVDTLLLLCKPPEDFAPIGNYKFDRKRLEDIDNRRHRIIHAEGLKSPLLDVDSDLEYILKTSHYLMGLVNQHYKVQIHPLKVFRRSEHSGPTAQV